MMSATVRSCQVGEQQPVSIQYVSQCEGRRAGRATSQSGPRVPRLRPCLTEPRRSQKEASIGNVGGVLFLAAGGQTLAQADFKANYKITMTQAATHPYGVGAQKFADLLKERTKGRITATVYTDSQLAKGEREMIEALQQGTIDIYVGSTGPVGNFSPSMGILDIPFLLRDNDHVDKALGA